ncbi:serine hydrolase domain-containing protein [Ferruginibacter sp.]|nr:serine hydrolase [Ferruginibacter sp.]
MNIVKLFIALVLLAVCTQTSAQSINKLKLEKFIDSIYKPFGNKNSPGCAVTIMENGKLISKKTYGMASIELQVPFSHQTVVKIGYSEAREFISIAAVLMEKDGILSLNDKVRQYFPKLPEWSDPVTIWDLLNHRSGFVDEWANLLLMHGAMSNRLDKEQFFRLLYNQPEPEVEPGKGFMYCNSDFGLLRLIMEKASGKNLPDWIKQRIFYPLKMNNTRMQKNALDIISNRATKYSHVGNGFEQDNVQKTSPGGNYFILTCADDLVKWSAAISDPVSEFNTAFKKLLANVRMIPGKKNHYVTGHSIDTINNQTVIFHEGVNGENYLSRIPSRELTIITMGNLDGEGFSEQNKLLCDYMLHAKKPPFIKPVFAKKPIPVTEAELKKYEGKYRWLNQVSWESYNEKRKTSNFFVENGKLKFRYSGSYIIELIPVGKDLFYYEDGFGAEIKFMQPEGNTPMRVKVTFDDGFLGEAMEKESAVWLPSPEDIKIFTGKYYSKHLNYYWNFELNEQGKMVLRRATMPDAIMEPDGENQFHYIAEKNPGAGFDQWILFNKNSAGEITGLTVWSGRVMHHRFDKQ